MSPNKADIAIVGAGARFTPGLLLGLVGQQGLAGATVRLCDLNESRLAVVEQWARRLSAAHGDAFRVRATTSVREALAGAAFVISTVRAGGAAATKADLDIPARHGIEQGVADTVGPGGLFFALRQVPALVEVAQTMEAVCPDAWLLTFSNPMTAMCRAVMRASTTRCIGLCDGIFGRRKWLGRHLGVAGDELVVRHAGINHMTWISSLQHRGQDVYPALRQREHGVGDQPISFQLMDVFGLFPSPGDRHIAEFFPYFHRADADGGRQYGLPTSVERWEMISSWRMDYEARFAAEANGTEPLPAPNPSAGEGTMELIAYLAGAENPATAGKRGDARDPLAGIFAANLPNSHGYVPGLQEWAIVEGFARADGDGLHPLPPVQLPPAILANLRARLDQIELTVEAALTGSRQVALQAMAADPLVPSLEQASAIVDELLARGGHPTSLGSTSVAAAAMAAIPSDQLSVLRRWFGWRDAPHALRQHLNEVAFAALRRRREEIAALRGAADWRRRQDAVRDSLRTLLGPLPGRTPVNARVTGVIQRRGFRVEKIVFESRPELFVTGCLFIPDHLRGHGGRAPAILNPIGHTDIAYRAESYQRLILHLVQQGFVVFPFDPVGQGERLQYFDAALGASRIGRSTQEHTYLGRQVFLTGRSPGHYFAWDGIRAIDYLLTRPEVDPQRIGVTGISGGGTQTAYIAALDDRVPARAPTCYITGFARLLDSIAPQDAEQNLLGALAAGIDHADFLEVRAPRPALVVATTGDFFSIQGARETCAEVVQAYAALGAPEAFGRVEDDHGHGYTARMREAICAFFQRALDLPGDPLPEPGEARVLLAPAELNATETGQVATSLGGETVFSLNRVEAVVLLEQLDARRRDLDGHLPSVRAAAVHRSAYDAPDDDPEAVFVGRLHHRDCAVERLMLSGGGPTLTPALVLVPHGGDRLDGSGAGGGGRPGVLVLHPNGKAAALAPDGVALALVRRGWIVLVPDLSGRGELEHETRYYEPVLVGRSVPGIHAAEIVRAARYLRSRGDVLPGTMAAAVVGMLGAATLHAAALGHSLGPVALLETPLSWSGMALHRYYETDFSSVVPGALRDYDLPDLAACLAPGHLLVANPVDHLDRPAPRAAVDAEWEVVRRAYGGPAVGDQLTLRTGLTGGAAAVADWLTMVGRRGDAPGGRAASAAGAGR